MDLSHYSKYYSVDKLFEDIIKLSVSRNDENIYSKLESVYLDGNYNLLFQLAIEYDLDDLVEYLYIFYGTTFEINKLSKQSIGTLAGTQSDNLSASVESSSGGNTNLKLSYWNSSDKNKNIVVQRLTRLIKYSSMTRKGKEFWYSFNPKWTNYVLIEI